MNCDILILDEATNSLDIDNENIHLIVYLKWSPTNIRFCNMKYFLDIPIFINTRLLWIKVENIDS